MIMAYFEITSIKFNHINVRESLPIGSLVYKAKVGDILKGNYDSSGNFFVFEINGKELKGVISKNATYETKEIETTEDNVHIDFTVSIEGLILDWNDVITKAEFEEIGTLSEKLSKVLSKSKIYKTGETIK